jgi:hypothetical protein
MRTNHIGNAWRMLVAVAVATVLTFAGPAPAHTGGKVAPTPASFADTEATLTSLFTLVSGATDLGADKNFLVKRAKQAMDETTLAEQLLAKGRKRQARTFLKRAARDLLGFEHRLSTTTSKSRLSKETREAWIATLAPVRSQLDGLRSTL